jgi:hypothetical protein
MMLAQMSPTARKPVLILLAIGDTLFLISLWMLAGASISVNSLDRSMRTTFAYPPDQVPIPGAIEHSCPLPELASATFLAGLRARTRQSVELLGQRAEVTEGNPDLLTYPNFSMA